MITMRSCNKFYRFSEFGREVVYNIEGVNAFFSNEIQSRLLDYLESDNTITNCIKLLKISYNPAEVNEALEVLKNEGVLTTNESNHYHDLSPTYALTLNLTQDCNLRCKYCYVDKTCNAASYMSEKVAKEAIDFLLEQEDLKGFGISFYGGEPLLNYDVMKSTMDYASKKAIEHGLPEVDYHLTTNGTLLTNEIITVIKDYSINVMVSMDGPASIHDSMRVTTAGKGTHTLVSRGLKKLIDTSGKHRISVSGVITNQNRLKTAYEYLSQFSLCDIKLSYARYLENCNYSLKEAQKEQYKEDMRSIALDCLELILRGVRPPYYNFENKILHLWKHSKRSNFCPAGRRRFGISPVGDIYPCGPSAVMGEWKLGTLKDGFNTSAMNKWMAITEFERRNDCGRCWARFLCAGGCPLQLVRAYDENGCEINKHSTKLAIAIYASIKEKREIMLAALVDEQILLKIRKMLKRN